MNHVMLTKDKLDVNAITDLVADNSCGAISMFIGTTRDNFEEKKVISLEYEAYEAMALKRMNIICEEARSKWPEIKHIAIYHRLDIVPIKEASVIIAISSTHRQTSLLAVQFAIDELKKSVPIWKKEHYENDGADWKENKECAQGRRCFKRPKLNFDSCTLEKDPISKNLIQIVADENEVSRRIQCFIEKKREEIDINNVLDFIHKKSEDGNNGETCARVNSIVIKQKDSKGHLKVQRVENEIGPQIKIDYTNTLDKLMTSQQGSVKVKQEFGVAASNTLPTGIAERIQNIENFLNINPKASADIYERVKTIENRILFLETVSPEYHHFLNPKMNSARKMFKKTYTVKDLDNCIQKIKQNVNKNSPGM